VIAKTIDIPEPDPKDEAITEAFSKPAEVAFRPFEQLAKSIKEATVMVGDLVETQKPNVLKLSTIQVKGETTGFRYNVGERLMINNNWNIELDQLNDFIAELNQVAKLVQAVRE
jgi:hypothetical protein